jgi:PPOX class probable F420-dependent enzyme
MTPLLALADERFISLTTYRRSGEAVSTPVWVGRDGEALVVLTPAGSGKVKRLRRDPRVEVRPCGRFGKVAEGVTALAGTAELREDPVDVERARATIRRTYPVESRVVLGIERLVERLRGQPRTMRLALHITQDSSNAR